MNVKWFIGAAAAALVSASGIASAATINVLQVNDFNAGGNPSAPVGFTLLNLGSGSANSVQTTSGFSVGGVTFSFGGGGSPASGEYAGSQSGLFASPFSNANSTKNYLVAGGNGGAVTAAWATAQTELDILWGTVDTDTNRNNITIGALTITGAMIATAITNQSFTFDGNGKDNVYLKITGLPSFTTATFTDATGQNPAFEFALGVTAVPGPIAGAGLPGLIVAAGGLLALARRRRARAMA